MILAEKLKHMNHWKHQELKQVYIPKTKGKVRPLGIPTLNDRAMQCHIKHALEPVYESYASKGSWGFRPGRCTHDVQKIIDLNLKSDTKGWTKSILELDIENCFDKIDHDELLKNVKLPNSAKRIVRQALKAGVMNERPKTMEDTPQGGVISPLLCNIAFHGIEDLANELDKYGAQRGFRYADDMIFILKQGESSEWLRKKINNFLKSRGLKINKAKTNLMSATEGFDFLGWHFKVINKTQKCRIQPSKKNYQTMVSTIKSTLKDSQFPCTTRLKKIQMIYRGWRNYHQYCDMSKHNGWALSQWINNYLRKKTKIKRSERTNWLKIIFTGHKWQVNKFVNVKMEKSPYDNDWLYWAKRQEKRYTGLLTRKIKF